MSGDKDQDSSTSSSPLVDDASVPRRLRQSSSLDINVASTLDIKNESRVLVLYTGGTIGMVRNSVGALAPMPQALEDKMRALSTMMDYEYSSLRFEGELNEKEHKALPLVLPHVPDHRRVIYTIYEYDPLLDSSNMTMDDWITISKDINDNYQNFDGFVILHGTDTMAYTASALSFILENLGKPVIITGSQIPCFEVRSDGRDNFAGALILAGNYNIPEVTVYFRHKLFRGNRTVKISSNEFYAFESPNMNPLVDVGIDIVVDHKSILKPNKIKKFQAHTKLNRNVVMLRLFPSITFDIVNQFLQDPVEGVVLQCYGAGNLPSNRKDIMKCLKLAVDRGVLILTCTQCSHGSVSPLYETGKALMDIGVILGSDITPEAALTKLSYVLSMDDLDIDAKRELMTQNLVGEITMITSSTTTDEFSRNKDQIPEKEWNILESVIQSLQIHTSKEVESVQKKLYPSILCSTVHAGQPSNVENLRKYGLLEQINSHDYDGRTPLHIACSQGNLPMVEYLLKNGAGVHKRDHNDDSPLTCSIKFGDKDVIAMLIECGAHLTGSSIDIGEILCDASRAGKKELLSSYLCAGANLNSQNLLKQTPIHVAVEAGHAHVVRYLLEQNVQLDKIDLYGRTPLDIAKILKRTTILELFSGK